MGGLISQRQEQHQRDVVCKRRRCEGPNRLKNQRLGDSQVVVCKIPHQAFLVPKLLLLAISLHLLRVVLAMFPPIVLVRLAPLPRALQADLLIHRIGSDLLPMIIRPALTLTCGVAANPLLRMIRIRLKGLLTVAAVAIVHQAAPGENGRRLILSGSAIKPEHASQKIQRILKPLSSSLPHPLAMGCR